MSGGREVAAEDRTCQRPVGRHPTGPGKGIKTFHTFVAQHLVIVSPLASTGNDILAFVCTLYQRQRYVFRIRSILHTPYNPPGRQTTNHARHGELPGNNPVVKRRGRKRMSPWTLFTTGTSPAARHAW
jgi:hypothetical protein